MKQVLFVLMSIALLSSCKKDDNAISPEQRQTENKIAIEAYLKENNLTAQSTTSGLYYIVEEKGNGVFPTVRDKVTVNYKLYTLEGRTLEQSQNPITFSLLNVIKGWQEGIPKFSEGGQGKLFVPSHLAYGERSPSSGKPLVFDVQLKKVN